MLQQQLSNTYKQIQELGKYEDSVSSDIVRFIENYKGKYIYPRTIKRKLNITMQEAYEILDLFVENKVLDLAFEIYCNQCDKFQNTIYNSLAELPIDLECEYCYHSIDMLKDIIIIYRVVDHE